MGYRRSRATVAALSFFISFSSSFLLAQTSVRPKIRIHATIDEHDRIMLRGNRHPLAQPEYEAGLLPPGRAMERMILALDSDPEQQKGFFRKYTLLPVSISSRIVPSGNQRRR